MSGLISIDGSTTNTGIAIFSTDTGELIKYLHIKPQNNKALSARENMDNRIKAMIIKILEIFNEYQPDVIVMEDTYGSKDLYTYKKLCHLQGMLLSCSIKNNIPLYFYEPNCWRKKIGIPITENKKRLKRDELKKHSVNLVKEKYGIDVTDDEADAICMGLAYLSGIQYNKKELHA